MNAGRKLWSALVLLSVTVVLWSCDAGHDATPMANATAGNARPLPAPRSGYHYQSADTQALQDDAFANPGTLWLDQGATLWSQDAAPGGPGRYPSCASCHGELATQPLRGVALRYPRLDAAADQLQTLASRINGCRTDQQQQAPWAFESDALLALTALVANQSHGMTLARTIDASLQPFFDAGEHYYYQRRGQMNLACHHCHENNVGRMLRGDRLSQGLGNGYPAYRLQWQKLGSLQRRLRFCNVGVRAEPHPFGAPEYANLELYLQWRATGLTVETPAVRR